MNRSQFLRGLVAAVAFGIAPLAGAQAWPAKPVTLVVPFPAGGHTDMIGRVLAEELGKRLGQPVVVENRPGVNGSLGTESVMRATPDGYTLIMGGVGTLAINPRMNANVKYDSMRELTHIALIGRNPNVLVASPKFEAATVKDVIAKAKAAPKSINFGLTGIGSSGHLAMELFKQSAGVDFTSIPYKGDSPAINDLLGGQVDLLFVNIVGAAPQVKAGKLRALAVTSATRSALLPDVPTLVESGLTNAVAESWTSLAAPAGLPQPIVDRLNREVQDVLAQPAIRDKLASTGTATMSGSPAEATAFVRGEVDKWAAVIAKGNIKAE